MEVLGGAKGNTLDGVFFTEGTVQGAHPVRHIHVEISRQNSNLIEVKRLLVQEAKANGANAVMNFQYGQRKHPWWELVFTLKWDTESWHGEGDAARIPE